MINGCGLSSHRSLGGMASKQTSEPKPWLEHPDGKWSPRPQIPFDCPVCLGHRWLELLECVAKGHKTVTEKQWTSSLADIVLEMEVLDTLHSIHLFDLVCMFPSCLV